MIRMLVATDGSPQADKAVELAARFARDLNAVEVERILCAPDRTLRGNRHGQSAQVATRIDIGWVSGVKLGER